MSTAAGDVDPGGGRSAADLAASALLGALLWDPRRLRDVVEWLRPEDFGHWADRAIYQTLVGLRVDGRSIDLQALPGILARGEYHDAHVDRAGHGPLSAAALHTLVSMTPATPRAGDGRFDGPERSEHVLYARLVLDDSIRRQVEASGTRLGQYARHLAAGDSVDAGQVLADGLADVEARLRGLADRVAAASGSTIHAARAPAAAQGRDAQPSAVPAAQPPTPAQLRRAEETLIGACLVWGEVRQLVAERLRVEDFTVAEYAATWHAISTLARRGEPVDFVLVAAQVERQGELPGLGRGCAPDDLARMAMRAVPGVAHRAVETVVHAALTRVLEQARDQLRGLAGDRAQSSDELVRKARRAVGGAERTTRRLTGAAAGPVSPAPPAPPAPPASSAPAPPVRRNPGARTPHPPPPARVAPSLPGPHDAQRRR